MSFTPFPLYLHVSELARIKSTCETLNQRLKSSEERVAASAKEYRQCLRQKDFYTQEMIMNIAMVPTLVRETVLEIAIQIIMID